MWTECMSNRLAPSLGRQYFEVEVIIDTVVKYYFLMLARHDYIAYWILLPLFLNLLRQADGEMLVDLTQKWNT